MTNGGPVAATSMTATDQQHPAALHCANVSKRYAGAVVLKDFDLVVRPGEIHALVGENGCGKSTFIKTLSGYHRPEPGSTIRIGGEPLRLGSADHSYLIGARFVQQDLGLVEALSVMDNMLLSGGFPARFLTVRQRAARRSVSADLKRIGLDLDPRVLVSALGPAERAEVAIARALRADPNHPARLLVLDEPTATLPSNDVTRLLATLRRVSHAGCAILYVTHRLEEVLQVADNVTVLRDGRKVVTRPIVNLTRSELVHLLVGRELDDTKQLADASSTVPEDQPAALRVRDLCAGPIDGLSFDVMPGEVLGIAGITGSGRETLLPALFAGASLRSGLVEVGGRVLRSPKPRQSVDAGVAYLPPDRKTLSGIMDLSVRENMTLSDLRAFRVGTVLLRKRERKEVRRWFDTLDIRPADGAELPLGSLSGGNQQKVLLAKWLRCQPKVLLLDEPTQGVDIGAKRELHQQILLAAASGAAVVVASTDVDELEALCNRLLILNNGTATPMDGSNATGAAISGACVGVVGPR